MRLLVLSQKNSEAAEQHRTNSLAEAIRRQGVKVDYLYTDAPGRILQGPVARQFRVTRQKIAWRDFDFIQAARGIHVLILSMRRRAGARILYDCQGLRYADIELRDARGINRLRSPVLRRLETAAAQRSDLCITVSEPLFALLKEWRGKATGLSIIRNGVDALRDFRPTAAIAQGDGFRVGYAGGFQSWQAMDLLVEAARELAGQVNIGWRIVGFGPEDQMMKREMAAALPDHAELIDRCDRPTLCRLLSQCDLLAIPRKPSLSCRVALPTKFAEFLAMGKPVLVNDVDETHEIVRANRCGFVAASDSHAMARTILTAFGCDRRVLRDMGLAGREYVLRELDWNVIGKAYVTFLEENLRITRDQRVVVSG